MKLLRTLLPVCFFGQFCVPIVLADDPEVKTGRQASEEIEKEFKPLEDPVAQQKFTEMGQFLVNEYAQLAESSPDDSFQPVPYEFHFKILEMQDDINAFALPGGWVYMTSRMWRLFTDDEKAAVVAHEIGHITHHHWKKRVRKERDKALLVLLGQILLKPNRAISQGIGLGSDLISLSYSRDDEKEADATSLNILTRQRKYEPWGYVRAFNKLTQLNGSFPKSMKILSSHPLTEERAKRGRDFLLAAGFPEPPKKERKLVSKPPFTEADRIRAWVHPVRIVGGDYNGAGAEDGLTYALVKSLNSTGQFVVEPEDREPKPSGAQFITASADISYKSVGQGQYEATCVAVVKMIGADGKEVREWRQTLSRRGPLGPKTAEPWQRYGVYSYEVDASLPAKTALECFRQLAYTMAPRADLLVAGTILKLDKRKRSAVISLKDGGVPVGTQFFVIKPLGEYTLDPETGDLAEREPIVVAVLTVTTERVGEADCKIEYQDGFSGRDIAVQDKLAYTPN
jgi:hypothetical protein